MKTSTMGRKGFFFTLGVVILMIPLLFLMSYYTESSKTRRDDSINKIRCDELHYLVEDVERDMQRAVVIFGRRAVLYATGWAVDNRPLANYTLNCSDACAVDCDTFSYDINGSEAAVVELVTCGTLNGTNVTYMVNHTLREWIDRIELHGRDMNFNVSLTLMNISVVPINAWEFSTILWNNLRITDNSGTCFYKDTPVMVMSNTSITGIEDPLYPMNTLGRITRYIQNCSINLSIGEVIGNSSSGGGEGTGSGDVILYDTIGGTPDDVEDFCDNHSAEELIDMILVTDKSFGVVCNPKVAECLNINSSKHFGGIINYGPNSNIENCNITVPWISDTGDIGLNDGDCVLINNTNTTSQVIRGVSSADINTTCYDVSDVTEYGENCSENHSNGPSFFDRLDGNYNLSERYVNQARDYFNNTLIGLETLVDPYELQYYGISTYPNTTQVDYLYWQNKSGCNVVGVCKADDYGFKLDCQHIDKYGYTAAQTCN